MGEAAGVVIEVPESGVATARDLAAAVAAATLAVPFGAEPWDFLTVLEEEAASAGQDER